MVTAVDASQDAVEWSSRHHFACIISTTVPELPPPFPAPPVPDALGPNTSIASMVGDIRMIRDVAECQLLHD
jgi:hypothetical protein